VVFKSDRDWTVLRSCPSGFVNESLTATIKAFDPAVSSDTGDLWLVAVQGLAYFAAFNPQVINPGESAVINVTITPTATSGTVVSGNLYIDDYVGALPPSDTTTGDELAAIPYQYSVKQYVTTTVAAESSRHVGRSLRRPA
jgi:hypothetical protein